MIKFSIVKKFIPLIALSIAALACQWTYLATELITESGQVMIQDDFSDPASGWPGISIEEGYGDYAGGGYRMVIDSPDYNFWAVPGTDFTAVRVDVDVIKLQGPDENRMGVICRYVDAQNFYYFTISADGYYAIGKVKDGGNVLLGQDMMLTHPAIRTGVLPNHLRADCIGDYLTLYVNDQLIASTQDSDFTAGDVGLITGSFDKTGVDVLFDNFVVYKP
jgi:hypothetical protein